MGPRGWLDRLVGLCLTLLFAAIALHVAVRLVEAVWLPLAIIGAVLLGVVGGMSWWRTRSGGW